jgi:hypothetical protein
MSGPRGGERFRGAPTHVQATRGPLLGFAFFAKLAVVFSQQAGEGAQERDLPVPRQLASREPLAAVEESDGEIGEPRATRQIPTIA